MTTDPRNQNFVFDNAATSNAIQTKHLALAYLLVGDDFAGQVLTIDVSEDGTTWYPLFDEAANEWRITLPAVFPVPNIAVNLMLHDFAMNSWMRLHSGFRAAPIAQDAVIIPGFRNLD